MFWTGDEKVAEVPDNAPDSYDIKDLNLFSEEAYREAY